MTNWFNAANLTDDKEFDNVTLTKTNVTQIEVSYKSGKYTHQDDTFQRIVLSFNYGWVLSMLIHCKRCDDYYLLICII